MIRYLAQELTARFQIKQQSALKEHEATERSSRLNPRKNKVGSLGRFFQACGLERIAHQVIDILNSTKTAWDEASDSFRFETSVQLLQLVALLGLGKVLHHFFFLHLNLLSTLACMMIAKVCASFKLLGNKTSEHKFL